MPYQIAVIGLSTGGLDAMKLVLPALPKDLSLSLVIVQHRNDRGDDFLIEYLAQLCPLPVQEAEDKLPIQPGTVYIAPAGYHLLIEQDLSFSLSTDPRVNYSCPAIDVLFESAADVFGTALIGIILTGANADGAQGLHAIKEKGGLTIVQDPITAEAKAMPEAALETAPDHIVTLDTIAPLLVELANLNNGESNGATL